MINLATRLKKRRYLTLPLISFSDYFSEPSDDSSDDDEEINSDSITDNLRTTVHPTYVKAETAFSSLRLFAPKIRNSLNDKIL